MGLLGNVLNTVALVVVAILELRADEASIFAGHNSPQIPLNELLAIVLFFATAVTLTSILPLRALMLPWAVVLPSALFAQVIAVAPAWLSVARHEDMLSDMTVGYWLTIDISVAVFAGLLFTRWTSWQQVVIVLFSALMVTITVIMLARSGGILVAWGAWVILPGIAGSVLDEMIDASG